MTETWAGLVREISRFGVCCECGGIENFASGQPFSYDGAQTEAQLKRLATLLERITPEMAGRVRAEATYQASDSNGADTEVAEVLDVVATLLESLAATPSEETD